jgi:hypothetical protein
LDPGGFSSILVPPVLTMKSGSGWAAEQRLGRPWAIYRSSSKLGLFLRCKVGLTIEVQLTGTTIFSNKAETSHYHFHRGKKNYKTQPAFMKGNT